MSILQKISDVLQLKNYTKNVHLARLSSQLKIKPEYLLLVLLGVLAVVVFLTRVGQCLVFLFIAYLYPVYKSVLSLEDKERVGTQKWLSYWIILGFFFSFNTLIDKVL